MLEINFWWLLNCNLNKSTLKEYKKFYFKELSFIKSLNYFSFFFINNEGVVFFYF